MIVRFKTCAVDCPMGHVQMGDGDPTPNEKNMIAENNCYVDLCIT